MSSDVAAADLTAKARIRIAALELFAEHGSAAATMRQVAERAGVTAGLVTHHYGSKDALRLAVDEYVVGLYREALQEIPESTGPNDVAAVRDANVARMLLSNPPVQKYLRRAYLEPDDGQPGVLEQLTDLTLAEVRQLRADRIASTRRSETDQAMQVVIRQLGELLMQPLVDRVWAHLDGERDARPTVRLHVESAAEDGPHR